MSEDINLLVVGAPFGRTGGQIRAKRSIEAYAKNGLNVKIIAPYSGIKIMGPNMSINNLLMVSQSKNDRIKYVGYIDLSNRIKKLPALKYTLSSLFLKVLKFQQITHLGKVDAVISLHENIDAIYFTLKLAKKLKVKAGVLLQNPPFIGNFKRRKKIEEVHALYSNLTGISTLKNYHQELIKKWLEYNYLKLLDNFDLIITVTKATAVDMGNGWMEKVVSLNPGVSLNTEDLATIHKINKKGVEKKDIIVYSGGFDIYKGIIDAILSFRLIRKKYKNLKLYITGKSKNPVIMNSIRKLIKKLDLKNNIVFTGFLSREELFRLKAEAQVILHPSHMDAFSYNVCESLYLNTPVVGYDIPALKIYYGNLEGIKLVKELDIEALSAETINFLKQKKSDIDIPNIPAWDDIMSKEIALIRGLVGETEGVIV
ncbi:glycosyltransferase family 4 protein [Candidatus Aciduliprofundum boonei]|uniref:Glycosyl transferase group 1 n=1 Tax=Aciduliprofundum boonei (strain DSM 19572 / T469) TaxID=439481 RepID=B5IDL2_ACIB4|nr:glycosyltransferase [Candidatus Aciduliprofundum boonei]ADD08086.1 glycosyl transferase group 1 [Aciduliprofundum boonei T469]EDY35472.1 glycosyl transferase, group 1 family protein [Aciduliprofundum boonei T469]EDY35662.1 glycosyl transferase, group 1 family protein [Aciduliprofundum boonei T469]